ncbi:MAG: flagellar basal body L-ring protein FlgH [Candidatus Hydrogenedentota bacterium]|nr:MAG: flagellar basal body L-ring protein FlgH [Candidatus Hydrogenedentota bacterium]
MNRKLLLLFRFSLISAVGAVAILLGAAQVARAVSLWNDNQSGLFQSRREFKVGDILLIKIEESTSADHKWKAERDKQTKVQGTAAPTGDGAGIHNLFGRFIPFMDLDYEAQHTSDNQSDRRVRVTASVAAEIVNITPNGNLQIVARKVMRVNSEEQTIELHGTVRPADVGPNNDVSSTAIADASIRVNGTLRFGSGEKPGLIERVVSFLSGLFF